MAGPLIGGGGGEGPWHQGKIFFFKFPKEAGDFWWTPVKWRRPFTLGATILEYNERNFFFIG